MFAVGVQCLVQRQASDLHVSEKVARGHKEKGVSWCLLKPWEKEFKIRQESQGSGRGPDQLAVGAALVSGLSFQPGDQISCQLCPLCSAALDGHLTSLASVSPPGKSAPWARWRPGPLWLSSLSLVAVPHPCQNRGPADTTSPQLKYFRNTLAGTVPEWSTAPEIKPPILTALLPHLSRGSLSPLQETLALDHKVRPLSPPHAGLAGEELLMWLKTPLQFWQVLRCPSSAWRGYLALPWL